MASPASNATSSTDRTFGYAFQQATHGYNAEEVHRALPEWAAYAEGLRVQLQATQWELQRSQASLAAARVEAGDTVAAARRGGSAPVVAARPEADYFRIHAEEEGKPRVAQPNQVATVVRTEAERFRGRLEDAIRGSFSDELMDSVPLRRVVSQTG
jgi:hypothetical protein